VAEHPPGCCAVPAFSFSVPLLTGMNQMNMPGPTMAQQVALAARAFQEQRTGHVPEAVTVVLGEDTLVVTLHGALSPFRFVGTGEAAGSTHTLVLAPQIHPLYIPAQQMRGPGLPSCRAPHPSDASAQVVKRKWLVSKERKQEACGT
jgi:Na+-translocating membrane potential-generating system MpsC-like protein